MLLAKYASLLPETSKDCLIQIGAHMGHEAKILEASGFRSIAWIEADPAIFELLKCNISRHDGSIHSVYNALITSTSGEHHRFFRYSNSGASSSLYRPTGWFTQTFDGVEITDDSIDLLSLSLDDFIEFHHIVPSCLIIDVQGAELEVLKGGSIALSTVNVIEVEISQQEIYSGGAVFKSVDRLLMSHGFTRVTHVPWHGDVLYVKIKDFGWLARVFLFFTSSIYATKYYSFRIKNFVFQCLSRPRSTFYKLTSRLRGMLY